MTSQTKSKTPEITAATSVFAPAAPVQPETKVATLVAMLVRAEGATLDQLVSATGWQPHTTRAALTRLKARGYVVTSVKIDGVRTYRASGPDVS
jgi:DNA-binding transcriptional regulator PaaX